MAPGAGSAATWGRRSGTKRTASARTSRSHAIGWHTADLIGAGIDGEQCFRARANTPTQPKPRRVSLTEKICVGVWVWAKIITRGCAP